MGCNWVDVTKSYNGKDQNNDDFSIINNKIYFINHTDNNKLYAMEIDGKNVRKVSDEEYIDFFYIEGGWVYFIRFTGIYKMKINSENSTQINGDRPVKFFTYKDWIYYACMINSKDMSTGIG